MIHRGLARPILGETREVPGRLERLSESAGRTPATTAVALLEWASDVAMSVYTAALHKYPDSAKCGPSPTTAWTMSGTTRWR